MVHYRRNPVPGSTFFFTLALADRRSRRLIEHASILRFAFRKARAERHFYIDAIVVLPDHLHAIFTLPEGDADFSQRWRRIKTVFTRGVLYSGETIGRQDTIGRDLWQRRFWEHTIRDDADFSRHVDYIHFNSTNTVWLRTRQTGRTRRSTASSAWASSPRIGGARRPAAMSAANQNIAIRHQRADQAAPIVRARGPHCALAMRDLRERRTQPARRSGDPKQVIYQTTRSPDRPRAIRATRCNQTRTSNGRNI